MTNQEQYELICEKAKKYDRLVDVLDKIRAEIEDEGAMFPDGEFFVSIYRINEIIDKYREEQE